MICRILILLTTFVFVIEGHAFEATSSLKLPKDHYLLAISGRQIIWFKRNVVTLKELEKNLLDLRNNGRPIILVTQLDYRIDEDGTFYKDLESMIYAVDARTKLVRIDSFELDLTSKGKATP